MSKNQTLALDEKAAMWNNSIPILEYIPVPVIIVTK